MHSPSYSLVSHASPMSAIMYVPSFFLRILSGFRSLWHTSLRWQSLVATTIYLKIDLASSSVKASSLYLMMAASVQSPSSRISLKPYQVSMKSINWLVPLHPFNLFRKIYSVLFSFVYPFRVFIA